MQIQLVSCQQVSTCYERSSDVNKKYKVSIMFKTFSVSLKNQITEAYV